jgi:hypothetical protein
VNLVVGLGDHQGQFVVGTRTCKRQKSGVAIQRNHPEKTSRLKSGGEMMKRKKKLKSEQQKTPQEQPQTGQVPDQLLREFLDWASERHLDHLAAKVLLNQLNPEQFDRAYSGPPPTESPSGFTVIYDEIDVGVGRHVYYLRSLARDEVTALAEFRRQFFTGSNPERWAWLLPVIRVHVGIFLPEYVKVFTSPPKVLVLHWPDIPY